MTCDRCYSESNSSIMSKFNRDRLCLPCKQDERLAPGFARAEAMEINAVRGGDYNFPGIGLSAADSKFLADRRAARS